MKLSAFLLCVVSSTMTQNNVLFVKSDCLVGDIMYQEGDSIGHNGRACCDNGTGNDTSSYIGVAGVCGPNGEIIEKAETFSCGGSVPYCVQCGTPGDWGAALCLSDPSMPSNCEYDNDSSEIIKNSTSNEKPLCTEVNTANYINSKKNGNNEDGGSSGSSNLRSMNALFFLLVGTLVVNV